MKTVKIFEKINGVPKEKCYLGEYQLVEVKFVHPQLSFYTSVTVLQNGSFMNYPALNYSFEN